MDGAKPCRRKLVIHGWKFTDFTKDGIKVIRRSWCRNRIAVSTPRCDRGNLGSNPSSDNFSPRWRGGRSRKCFAISRRCMTFPVSFKPLMPLAWLPGCTCARHARQTHLWLCSIPGLQNPDLHSLCNPLLSQRFVPCLTRPPSDSHKYSWLQICLDNMQARLCFFI